MSRRVRSWCWPSIVLLSFLWFILIYNTSEAPVVSASPGPGVRVAFFADPHWDGGAGDEAITDLEAHWTSLSFDDINPAYIFSLGDLTKAAGDAQFNNYKVWKDNLPAPVYDTLGGHDQPSRVNPNYDYDGFFTELNWPSTSMTYKLGNTVFIILGLSRGYGSAGTPSNLRDMLQTHRLKWLENQLATYCPTNNVIIMNHHSLFWTTCYSGDAWAQLGKYWWTNDTDNVNALINQYNPDAWLSGHIHMDYDWVDTPTDDQNTCENDRDGDNEVEWVGKFVNGNENDEMENCYYLLMPTLDRHHGGFYKRAGCGMTTENNRYKLAIYWADFENGADNINVWTREVSSGWLVHSNVDVENYVVQLSETIDTGNGQMEFMGSDLCFRQKVSGSATPSFDFQENEWFKTVTGNTVVLEFSQAFAENVYIDNVVVENRSTYSSISWQYKGCADVGPHFENWDASWSSNPSNINGGSPVRAVLLRGTFDPDGTDFMVRDINVNTSTTQNGNGGAAENWTVNTESEWWDSTSTTEYDVRSTIKGGSLQLTGENCLAWYSFDSGPSDLTSLNNDGDNNGATLVPFLFSNAYDFESTENDNIEIPDDLGDAYNTGLTISCWINLETKASDLGANETIFTVDTKGELPSGYTNILLKVQTTDQVYFSYMVDGAPNEKAISTTTIENGENYFLTGVIRENKDIEIWIGGVKEGTDTDHGSMDLPYDRHNFGTKDGVQNLDGIIDEFVFWDYALTENQILRHSNQQEARSNILEGVWSSIIWDSGDNEAKVENLQFGATIGANENLWGNISSDANDDGVLDDNTGWTSLDGLGGIWNNPNVDNGYRFQVQFRLQTDTSTATPTVDNYILALSTQAPPPENKWEVNSQSEWSDDTGDYIDTWTSGGSLHLGDYVYLIDDFSDNKLTSRDNADVVPLGFDNAYFNHVENAIIRPEWTTTSGTPLADNGILHFPMSATNQIVSTSSSFFTGCWVWDYIFESTTGNSDGMIHSIVQDENNKYSFILVGLPATKEYIQVKKLEGGAGSVVVENGRTYDTSWHEIKFARDSSDNWQIYHNNIYQNSAVDTFTIVPENLEIRGKDKNTFAKKIDNLKLFDPARFQPQGWWRSINKDLGSNYSIDNLSVVASISAQENVTVRIENSHDGISWDFIENTVQNGTNTYNIGKEGQYVRVRFDCSSDNEDTSPSIDSFAIYYSSIGLIEYVAVWHHPEEGWGVSTWLSQGNSFFVNVIPAMEEYTLTVLMDGEGTIELFPVSEDPITDGIYGGTYYEDTTVSITANPASGWYFAYWSGDASGTTRTINVMMNSNKDITAHFTIEPITYDLTTEVNPNGAGSVSPSSGTYEKNEVVSISANPATDDWVFDQWSGDASGTSRTVEIIMNSNKHVIANFVEQPPAEEYYLTTYVALGEGSISRSPDKDLYSAGEVVTISAEPATDGWVFDHWSGDLSGSQNPATVTMNSNRIIGAVFTEVGPGEVTLTMQVIPPQGGTVSYRVVTPTGEVVAAGEASLLWGSLVELTAFPNEGYEFDYWTGDVVGGDSIVQVTMDEDKTAIAIFKELEAARNYWPWIIIAAGVIMIPIGLVALAMGKRGG